MSRANMTVRFADGKELYGLYDGNSDYPLPRLFATQDEAWRVYRGDPRNLIDPEAPYRPPLDAEDVTVRTDYGGSFDLEGSYMASRSKCYLWDVT